MRYWLKKNLKKCANTSLETGSRLDFQQVSLIAGRTNISLEELEKGDFYALPEPKEGYKHIGYYLAEIMIFCDEVKNFSLSDLSSEQKEEILNQFETHIKNCQITGQFSNLWKLLAVKKIFLEKNGIKEFDDSELLNLHFNSCEYSNFMRFQQAKKFNIL